MQAETRTLQKVLHGDRRFRIPVYQRPYVWEPEKQWQPLWDDIETTAVRLAEVRQVAHAQGKGAPAADKDAAPHFLGAVVLEQLPTGTGDVELRSIVDGQQRLTTLQLLLRGTLDALEELHIVGKLPTLIERLVYNDPAIVSGDDLHKIDPRPADRTVYMSALASRRDGVVAHRFQEARAFFGKVAADFLRDPSVPEDPYAEGPPEERRASLLVATLLGLVKLVVIDLEDADDAQVIFEALNARNTPLSATDLVKNLLFMRAQAVGHDPQELYERVWRRFDKEELWWRGLAGVGHAQRARQDWLLGDWLIAQRGRTINVGRLYGEFRRWVDETATSPVDALDTLGRYATAYEALHGRKPGASRGERRAYHRIQQLNITVATPVLLWLLTRSEDELPLPERELAFAAIESYVIRRMAAKLQTRGYGLAFADVLAVAKNSQRSPGRAVIEALRTGPHGYAWPADDELVDAFRTGRYYGAGGINRERLRLLLGAVDELLQNERHKGEPLQIDYDQLQVEHVIPREWKKHWPVLASSPEERLLAEQRREAHVNRIGNLTLASALLNPSMGNDPWETKRDALQQHSHLRLNALLRENSEWNEDAIVRRGEWLAQQVGRVWPSPHSQRWG